ncbi:MAG: hypothetical protein RIB46_18305 [Pseudomonadales bacterium]
MAQGCRRLRGARRGAGMLTGWLAAAWLLAGTALAGPAQADVQLSTEVVKVESVLEPNGRVKRQLLPADQVVAGDELRYTITFTNDSERSIEAGRIVITNALPEGTRYVPGSAGGDGAQVEYSVDGETFLAAEPAASADPAGVATEVRALRWTYRRDFGPGDMSDVFFHVRMQ